MSPKTGCNWFYIFLAVFCTIGSLGLGILTFIYHDWMRYTVSDTLSKSNSIIYYTRRRGIFWEGVINEVNKTNLKLDVNGNLMIDLGSVAGGDDNYQYIINLRRARLGVHASAFIVMAVVLLLFLGSLFQFCMTKKQSRNQMVIRLFCGVVCLLGGLCYMISMIIFHILHDEEKVTNVTKLPYIYHQWDQSVKQNTVITYGSMYYVNWGACFLSLMAALIFLTSNICCQKSEPSTKYSGGKVEENYCMSQFKVNGSTSQPVGIHSTELLRSGIGPGISVTPAGGVPYRNLQDDERSLRSGVSGGAHRLPRYPVDRGHDGPYASPDSPPLYSNNSRNYRVY